MIAFREFATSLWIRAILNLNSVQDAATFAPIRGFVAGTAVSRSLRAFCG
jgi:hypothetical protein